MPSSQVNVRNNILLAAAHVRTVMRQCQKLCDRLAELQIAQDLSHDPIQDLEDTPSELDCAVHAWLYNRTQFTQSQPCAFNHDRRATLPSSPVVPLPVFPTLNFYGDDFVPTNILSRIISPSLSQISMTQLVAVPFAPPTPHRQLRDTPSQHGCGTTNTQPGVNTEIEYDDDDVDDGYFSDDGRYDAFYASGQIHDADADWVEDDGVHNVSVEYTDAMYDAMYEFISCDEYDDDGMDDFISS